MENKILYQLTTEDFQTVSEEILGRKLSSKEIGEVQKKVEEKIEWHSIISDSVIEIKHQGHHAAR
jgi:hypothetical protein